MPIFEYQCNGCGQRFERLSRGAAAVECPSCAASDVARQLSSFAVATRASSPRAAAPAPVPGGCGSCGDPRGPGACSR